MRRRKRSPIDKPADGSVVHPAGIVLSVIGALVLLWAWSHLAH